MSVCNRNYVITDFTILWVIYVIFTMILFQLLRKLFYIINTINYRLYFYIQPKNGLQSEWEGQFAYRY